MLSAKLALVALAVAAGLTAGFPTSADYLMVPDSEFVESQSADAMNPSELSQFLGSRPSKDIAGPRLALAGLAGRPEQEFVVVGVRRRKPQKKRGPVPSKPVDLKKKHELVPMIDSDDDQIAPTLDDRLNDSVHTLHSEDFDLDDFDQDDNLQSAQPNANVPVDKSRWIGNRKRDRVKNWFKKLINPNALIREPYDPKMRREQKKYHSPRLADNEEPSYKKRKKPKKGKLNKRAKWAMKMDDKRTGRNRQQEEALKRRHRRQREWAQKEYRKMNKQKRQKDYTGINQKRMAKEAAEAARQIALKEQQRKLELEQKRELDRKRKLDKKRELESLKSWGKNYGENKKKKSGMKNNQKRTDIDWTGYKLRKQHK